MKTKIIIKLIAILAILLTPAAIFAQDAATETAVASVSAGFPLAGDGVLISNTAAKFLELTAGIDGPYIYSGTLRLRAEHIGFAIDESPWDSSYIENGRVHFGSNAIELTAGSGRELLVNGTGLFFFTQGIGGTPLLQVDADTILLRTDMNNGQLQMTNGLTNLTSQNGWLFLGGTESSLTAYGKLILNGSPVEIGPGDNLHTGDITLTTGGGTIALLAGNNSTSRLRLTGAEFGDGAALDMSVDGWVIMSASTAATTLYSIENPETALAATLQLTATTISLNKPSPNWNIDGASIVMPADDSLQLAASNVIRLYGGYGINMSATDGGIALSSEVGVVSLIGGAGISLRDGAGNSIDITSAGGRININGDGYGSNVYIKDLAEPTDAGDAATKAYVDAAGAQLYFKDMPYSIPVQRILVVRSSGWTAPGINGRYLVINLGPTVIDILNRDGSSSPFSLEAGQGAMYDVSNGGSMIALVQ